jgi:hypothetical protein
LERLEDRLTPSTFVVSTTADSGPGSLRQAITDSNAAPGGNTITIEANGTINLFSALPAISNSVIIQGPGLSHLTVEPSANQQFAFPIFVFDSGTTDSVNGLTLSGGQEDITNAGTLSVSDSVITQGDNAGISSSGTLSVENVTVDHCIGPGIDATGAATVSDSRFSNDSTGVHATGGLVLSNTTIQNCSQNPPTFTSAVGGGVYVAGGATIRDCVIEDNSAIGMSTFGGGAQSAFGGGLYIQSGSVMITGSTFAGNSATGGTGFPISAAAGFGGAGTGGGIYIASGSVQMVNDTLAANSATGGDGGEAPSAPVAGAGGNAQGGGIYAATGTLNIVNCTIAGNSVRSGEGSQNGHQANPGLGQGGGIYDASAGVTMTNTILAGNAANTSGPDGQNAITGDYNLIQNPSGIALSGATSHTITGRNPDLGPLQDNGGPTPTEALLPGSPALGAGTSAGAPSTDQRGVPRGSPPDIGAYEANPSISAIPNQSGAENVPLTVTFTVGSSGGPVTGVTATSSNQALVANSSLQISGSGNSRTLTILPTTGQTGTTNISVTVSNGVGGVTETFQVTIGPVPEGTIAAVGNGTSTVVFLIGTDRSLWRYANGSGWQQIGGAGTIQSISAVLQPGVNSSTGDPTVFAVTTKNGLAEYDNAGWRQVGGDATIESVSAGTDRHGRADAFVLTTNDQLTEWSTSAGWLPSPIGGAGTILQYSAFTLDRVDVVATDHSVYGYDPAVGWFSLNSPVAAENVSTAPDGTAFVTTVDEGLYRFTTSSGWTPLGGSGSILAAYAGLDRSGRPEVFVQTTAGTFAEYSVSGGWQILSSNQALSASATTIGEVAALFSDGSVSVHDDVSGWFAIAGPGFGLQ